MTKHAPTPCPCGRGDDYRACCGRWIDGGQAAATAEELMRSRYTAFSLGRADYLHATWDPRTRPAEVGIDPAVRWIGLKIVRTEEGGSDADTGTVEFVARYKVGGRADRLHEVSRFRRVDRRWVYVEATVQ